MDQISSLISLSRGSEAEWAAMTDPIPDGVLVHSVDKKVIKQGNGTDLYNALPVFIYLDPQMQLKPGMLILWPSDSHGAIPPGFLVADGSWLSVSTYADLFAVYGFNHGGNGNDMFALPNIRIIFSSTTVLIKY